MINAKKAKKFNDYDVIFFSGRYHFTVGRS